MVDMVNIVNMVDIVDAVNIVDSVNTVDTVDTVDSADTVDTILCFSNNSREWVTLIRNKAFFTSKHHNFKEF